MIFQRLKLSSFNLGANHVALYWWVLAKNIWAQVLFYFIALYRLKHPILAISGIMFDIPNKLYASDTVGPTSEC